ncbi:MAG TPA: PaaI family thioesterase [Gemmatimonadaceae bacterium]|nr:PaaI family thioesterase [Gemmatimonadaceae bacterium]
MINAWTPQDPGYEARVRESFGRQSHMATLGASIAFIAPGQVHLALPFAPSFCQQNGYMHAGAIASVADSANGYAAFTLAPPETDVLAVEFKINLLAPAQGESFLACGRVLRPGRTLTICQADVFALAASERVLVATMLSTIIVRPAKSSGAGALR